MSVIVVALLVGLSVWLAPWWKVGSVPVALRADLPRTAQVAVQWDAGEPPLKLYPAKPKEGARAEWWVAELPPRRQYAIALVFEDAVQDVRVEKLTLRRLVYPEYSFALLGNAPADNWEANGVVLDRREDGSWALTAEAGGRLACRDPVRMAHDSMSKSAASVALTVAALLAVSLAAAMAPFTTSAQPRLRETVALRGWLLGVIACCAALHLMIVSTATPEYWPADSTSYLRMTWVLLTEGSFGKGGFEFELNRTPGVSLMQVPAFVLFGYEISSVTLLQSLLFVAVTIWMLRELRYYLPRWALAGVAALTLLGAPSLWSVGTATSEGPFLVASIAVMAGVIRAWRTGRLVAWVVVAVLCGYALMVRQNALVLATPGILLALAALRQRWLARSGETLGQRLRELTMVRLAWLGLTPVLGLGVAYVAYASVNYNKAGLFVANDLRPVARANVPLIVGTFDPRALEAYDGLSEYVAVSRFDAGYWFHGWGVRRYFYYEDVERARARDWPLVREVMDHLDTFARTNDALLPAPMWLVSYLRPAFWSYFSTSERNHIREFVNRNFSLEQPRPNQVETVAKSIRWATHGEVSYQSRNPGALVSASNYLAREWYPYWRLGLVLLGLGGYLVAARRGWTLPLLFYSVYFANSLVFIVARNHYGRYIQVYHALLAVALLATIAAWMEWRRERRAVAA